MSRKIDGVSFLKPRSVILHAQLLYIPITFLGKTVGTTVP